MPRYPLANQRPEPLEYTEGMKSIDWETMNIRDYNNAQSRSVCIAECLSPQTVTVDNFLSCMFQTIKLNKMLK